MRRELGVDREQIIEYAISVIARDIGRRPYRVEHAQIGLRDETERLLVVRGASRTRRDGRGERRGCSGFAEITAGQFPGHGGPPLLGTWLG